MNKQNYTYFWWLLNKSLLLAIVAVVMVSGCTSSDNSADLDPNEDILGESEGSDIALDGEGEEISDDSEGEVAVEEEDELDFDDVDSSVADGSDSEGSDTGSGSDIGANSSADASDVEELSADDIAAFGPSDSGTSGDRSAGDPTQDIVDAASVSLDEAEALKPVVPFLPLLKMRTEAFAFGKTNLNRLYFPRSGEGWSQVSQKIYGTEDRVADLKKWNSYISDKGLRDGDKIYYASASNPTDTAMLLYYEEVGQAPEFYETQKAENIRSIAESILGSRDSWKELWSTNLDVESKQELPAGTRLKYFKGASAGIPVAAALGSVNSPANPSNGLGDAFAQANPGLSENPAMDAPETFPGVQNSQPNVVQNEGTQADQGFGNTVPSPNGPGGSEFAQPTPTPTPTPPAVAVKPAETPAAASTPRAPTASDQMDTQMLAMVAGGIAIFLALLVLVKKRKDANKLQDFSQTQV